MRPRYENRRVRARVKQILKTEMRSWENFGRLQFRLQVKRQGESRRNVPTPAPDITNVAAFIRISLFHFTLTNAVKFVPLLELETPYL